jgi:surface carbohydrate biosynthesis protein
MSAKNSDYLILVEHTARELDIACLIKYLIEQKGSTIDVMPLPYFNAYNVGRKNHSKVLVAPYCYRLGIYKPILSHFTDISLINLAYEQILAKITNNMKAPKDEFTKKFVVYNAWSENYFNYLTKCGVDPANITINGNLSYALYKYPYRTYFNIPREHLSEKYHLDISKKWLFIPENYGAAFTSDTVMNDKITNGMDPVDAIKYREFAAQSLHVVIQWCARASKSNDIEIIFRPRPAISYQKMQEFFTNVLPEIPDGLKIIKDHTVREWILASDVVMSSYSTTLIEAAIAEKPIAMLEPIPFPDYLDASWYNMVPKIVNYDDFIKAISLPSPDSYQCLKRWAETEMMSRGDPIQGVVNLMLAVKKGGIRIPEIYTKKPDESGIRGLLNRSLDHFHSLKSQFFVQQPKIVEDYENDYFASGDVAQRVARWKKILNENKLT